MSVLERAIVWSAFILFCIAVAWLLAGAILGYDALGATEFERDFGCNLGRC